MEEIMIYVTLALTILSLVLHVVAPKTKNTTDDKLSEGVDDLLKVLPKKEPK